MLIGYLSPGQGRNITVQEGKSVAPATIELLVEPDEGYDALASVTVEAAPLQDKTVAPAVTQQVVEADSDNYGLSSVTVEAAPLQSKAVAPAVTQQVVEPDSGNYGLSSVTIEAAPLQDKTVAPAVTQQVVEADSDNYGLSSVTVEAAPLQVKTVAPAVTQQVVEPDSGNYGLSSVTIEAAPLQSKAAAAGDTVVADAGYYGLGQVSVRANVLQSKTVNPAATQQTVNADSGYDGLGTVTVNAAPLQAKIVTPSAHSQTVEPDSGNYGLSSVTVEAAPEASLQAKRATLALSQQILTADAGYDGLSEVTVPAGLGGGDMSTYYLGMVQDADVAKATAWDRIVLYRTSGARMKEFSVINNQDITVKSSSAQQSISVPSGYTGHGTVTVEPLVLQDKTVTPTTAQQTITADSGYDGLGTVTVNAGGGGSSELENRLFNITAGKATITHSGTFYGLTKLRRLILSGATVIYRDCWSYYESGEIEIECPDATNVQGYAFRNSNMPKLTVGKAGGSNAITFSGASIQASHCRDLWLPGDAVVTLQGTAGISALSGLTIHVPSALLADYQAATNWSALTNVTWEAIA